jgi:hypothetical protein
MDVAVDIEYDDVDTERGTTREARFVPGVRVTCTRCQNWQESLGTGVDSIQSACARLKTSCPKHEQNNYYSQEA